MFEAKIGKVGQLDSWQLAIIFTQLSNCKFSNNLLSNWPIVQLANLFFDHQKKILFGNNFYTKFVCLFQFSRSHIFASQNEVCFG